MRRLVAAKCVPGAYLLVARLARASRIRVGKLGTADFPAGFYVYCGSALGGLMGRIGRHLSNSKRLHWHIDYLLAQATVEKVWCCRSFERLECRLSEAVSELKGARVILPHFGASDCRCPSHLWYFPERPSM